jgi:hypothetical protein
MNLKELTLKYFDTFSNKDVDGLKELFSKDITLRDWDLNVGPVAYVLHENKKMFKMFDTINIVPINIAETGNLTVSEIEIYINNDDALRVVDVIEFNSDGKICAIRAYKG